MLRKFGIAVLGWAAFITCIALASSYAVLPRSWGLGYFILPGYSLLDHMGLTRLLIGSRWLHLGAVVVGATIFWSLITALMMAGYAALRRQFLVVIAAWTAVVISSYLLVAYVRSFRGLLVSGLLLPTVYLFTPGSYLTPLAGANPVIIIFGTTLFWSFVTVVLMIGHRLVRRGWGALPPSPTQGE